AVQAAGQFFDASALVRILLGGGGGRNDRQRGEKRQGDDSSFHDPTLAARAAPGQAAISADLSQTPGISTQKVAPSPTTECTPISPPCSSTSRLASVRPTPCPSMLERSRPRRLKGSKS